MGAWGADPVVDNPSNDLAGYDDDALRALPGDLPDLDGTGYDQDSLDELLRQVQVLDPGRDTDPEEPPSEPSRSWAIWSCWVGGGPCGADPPVTGRPAV